jgi:glycosyltransferase involved in cell wall biosynthesis
VPSGVLVSVVIPCFNHGRYLAEAIRSVQAQSHPEVETIVVDDASTDDTPSVAAAFPRLRYLRHARNRGLARSRNAGLEVARGDFVIFLDADDYLLPDGIAAGVHCVEQHPRAAFAFGMFDAVSAEGTLLWGRRERLGTQDLYANLLVRNAIEMIATAIFRRDLVVAAGGFDPRFKACEDYDLLLRLTREHPAAEHDAIVACYRRHRENMSHRNELMLRAALQALRRQRPYLRDRQEWAPKYQEGLRFWKEWYGRRWFSEAHARAQRDEQPLQPDHELLRLERVVGRSLVAQWRAASAANSNERIPRAPPRIAAIPGGVVRPLWSVMLPVFNAGAYFEQALRSVLDQDPGTSSMQIAVIDDASTDVDVEALARRVAGSRIEYHRQAQNVGSVRNFNSCLDRSRGRYVHLLHADDRVLAGYYQAMERLFSSYPEAGAAFCGVRYINEQGEAGNAEQAYASADGILPDWLDTIATGPRIQHAAISMRREVYESLGGFFGVNYSEDWEMHVRIASRYPMAYTPRTFAEYRTHKDSISRAKVRSGGNLDDMAWVIETIQGYLPREKRTDLRRRAERECALYGLHYAKQLWRYQRDRAAAQAQLDRALRLCSLPEISQQAIEIESTMRSP